MKHKILAIVDGDTIVYRAGFAGESLERHIVWSPQGRDEILMEQFAPSGEKTALVKYKEWLATFPEDAQPDILEEEQHIVPEELPKVLSTVRAMLKDILYSVAHQFNCSTDDIHMRLLLSGPGNFRNEIATVAGYKANRKDDHKPYWYQQIRNYMTDWWDAEVIEGREADDECSIQQREYEGESVIVTIDKDLDQVPGWHYNFWRKVFYYTAEEEGQLLFYKQVLTGDSTDNIPGAHRIGAERADRIVDDLYLQHGMDHEQIWKGIVAIYQKTIDKYGEKCKYYDKAMKEGAEAVAIEMARLVKMQEYIGQLWTPPGQPDEVLEVEFES